MICIARPGSSRSGGTVEFNVTKDFPFQQKVRISIQNNFSKKIAVSQSSEIFLRTIFRCPFPFAVLGRLALPEKFLILSLKIERS